MLPLTSTTVWAPTSEKCDQHTDSVSKTTVVSLSQSEANKINLPKNLVLLIPCIWIALQPQILFQKCSYQKGWKTIGNLIASLVSFLALRINWYKIFQIGTNKIDRWQWCWRQNYYVGDFFRYVGDYSNVLNRSPTSWIGYQHLKLVTNTFGLQHPSPTSM